MKRVAFGILLFVSVFLFPWWGVLAIAIYGAWRFSFYYEILIAGVCFDLLYGGAGLPFVLGFGLLGTLCSAAVLFAIERIKQEVRS